MDTKTEKKTTPSKKELLRDIEALDKASVFDSTSLGRTNIANLLAIKELLSEKVLGGGANYLPLIFHFIMGGDYGNF